MRDPLHHTRFLNLVTVIGLVSTLWFNACENDFSFTPPPGSEICGDGLDNDNNGLTDCRDPDCASVCRPQITLSALPDTIAVDSVRISGTHLRANSILVSVSPAGLGGQAALSGFNWSFTVKGLSTGIAVITATATDSTGLRDSVMDTLSIRIP